MGKKPLPIFKELLGEGKRPMFMPRKINRRREVAKAEIDAAGAATDMSLQIFH